MEKIPDEKVRYGLGTHTGSAIVRKNKTQGRLAVRHRVGINRFLG